MIIQSTLSKEKYLSSLKRKMSGHMELGTERFTGFFAGRWFYTTHHCAFRWNHRISSQKNGALGYVKETEDGCEVHFIRFRGLLSPVEFAKCFLILTLFTAMYFWLTELEFGYQFPLFSLAITVLAALIVTFLECTTEAGNNGRRLLISMLRDPSDPRANLPYIP